MELWAGAKLNLTLDVLGKRPDGYHDLRMIMQSVRLGDSLHIETGESGQIHMRTNRSYLPCDSRNLAVAAAERFLAHCGKTDVGLRMKIEKRIPVCAGLGGGSSDAAAVLRGLNEMLHVGLDWKALAKIGEEVGSDVPYCVLGGTALAEGRGERLTPLPALPHCYFVLCKPDFSISTPSLFARLDGVHLRRRPDTAGAAAALEAGDLAAVARRMYNVFEDVLPVRRAGEVSEVKSMMIEQGALGACMSGTGPTVFGLFPERSGAEEAYRALKETYREVFLTETV